MVIRKRIMTAEPGLVFVTTTTVDWLPVFAHECAAIETVRQLDITLKQYHASLVGYVLMPSHIHTLIGLPFISCLSRFVQTFKSMSSRQIKYMSLGGIKRKLVYKGKFRLWKPRFDDIVIMSEQQFRIKLEYIHSNPVKAGLVGHPADWPFSSAGDWVKNRKGLIEIDKSFSWVGNKV